jgi:hypothetical protein
MEYDPAKIEEAVLALLGAFDSSKGECGSDSTLG